MARHFLVRRDYPVDGKSLSKANSEETHRGTVCLQNVETATEDIASIRLKHVCIDPAVDCEIDAQSLNPWRRRKMRRLHGAIRQRMVSVAAQAAPALSYATRAPFSMAPPSGAAAFS